MPSSTFPRSPGAEQVLAQYHAAHPATRTPPGPTNWPALLLAVRPPAPPDASAEATIQQLLSAGDGAHSSILALALAEDKPDYAALALALGAPPDGPTGALVTPLEAHARRPRAGAAAARALLVAGARATPRALAAAAAAGNEEVVAVLLAAGADARVRRRCGRNALHAVAGGGGGWGAMGDEEGRVRVARLLVEAGASVKDREVPAWMVDVPGMVRFYSGGWRPWQIAQGNKLLRLSEWLRERAGEGPVGGEDGGGEVVS